MSQLIEVTVNSDGCILISGEAQANLGLSPGMTLIVETRDKGDLCLRIQKESPEILEKGGILVFKGRVVGDLSGIVRHERDRRLSKLMQQVDI